MFITCTYASCTCTIGSCIFIISCFCIFTLVFSLFLSDWCSSLICSIALLNEQIKKLNTWFTGSKKESDLFCEDKFGVSRHLEKSNTRKSQNWNHILISMIILLLIQEVIRKSKWNSEWGIRCWYCDLGDWIKVCRIDGLIFNFGCLLTNVDVE